jgi:hypothetical protein
LNKEFIEPERALPHISSNPADFRGQVILRQNINGQSIPITLEATHLLQSLATSALPFYPTISMSSENTRVWCRFCEADVVLRDRHSIQAPLGVRVYCLDGSLLLNENQ